MSNHKIKLLFNHPSLSTGGAEELRFLVLSRLKANPNYDLKVCCIEEIGEVGRKIEALGIEVFCLKRSSKPFNFLATLALFRYLKRNKFDIVQTSLFNANFHGRIAAFFAGVRIKISEEHSEHYQYRSFKFAPYVLADKGLSYITDKIVPCSHNLMKHIIKLEHIPQGKFFPLINTFDAQKLKVKKDLSQMRKELGLSDKDQVIGNVAALSSRKGQDKLIKAFKLIRDSFPAAKLLFIGNERKEFKEELLVLTKSLGLSGSVLFLGRKENIADYINLMDVFVLSSNFEGIPLALLEAMYMHRAVVASNIGGIPEVITHGKNGFLVDSTRPESIAQTVIQLLSDRQMKERVADEAFETARGQFNTEAYVEKLESLYSQLLKEKNVAISGRN